MVRQAYQHKIRVIQKDKTGVVLGVTLPANFKHWLNLMVTIKESGNSLILESGAKVTPMTNIDMKSYIQNNDVVDIKL